MMLMRTFTGNQVLNGFILMLILISTSIKGQEYKDIDFLVIFGDCFDNDTVSISINDHMLVESAVLSSDFSTGLTYLDIYQVFDTLTIRMPDGKVMNNTKMDTGKTLIINLMVGHNRRFEWALSLRKGKVILIDHCMRMNEQGNRVQVIDVSQHKRKLEFD